MYLVVDDFISEIKGTSAKNKFADDVTTIFHLLTTTSLLVEIIYCVIQ